MVVSTADLANIDKLLVQLQVDENLSVFTFFTLVFGLIRDFDREKSNIFDTNLLAQSKLVTKRSATESSTKNSSLISIHILCNLLTIVYHLIELLTIIKREVLTLQQAQSIGFEQMVHEHHHRQVQRIECHPKEGT
jgi:hypothetical protein